jgi:anti-sigma regulatory factor (Ser/Thr protein kinase)
MIEPQRLPSGAMRAQTQSQVDAILRLPPEIPSVPDARRRASEYASTLMSPEQLANLELALTELVANSVRHSQSSDEITIALTPKDGFLCVRVTDGGTGLVPRPGAMDTEPGAGYGLFLVEQLTRRWGMTREDDRTRVWFEIDYR